VCPVACFVALPQKWAQKGATAAAAEALKLPQVGSLKNHITFEIKAMNKKGRKMAALGVTNEMAGHTVSPN